MADLTPEERAEKVAQEFPATPYIDKQWKEKLAFEICSAVTAEIERCCKAICEHCAAGTPTRWWPGAGGFLAHHDSVGTNIGSCAAAAIRKETP